MLQDEAAHEKEFEQKTEGGAVKYISFIVLGLADALVEIAGIHAGSLGIYNSTHGYAGLAGIVAGARSLHRGWPRPPTPRRNRALKGQPAVPLRIPECPTLPPL